MHGVGIVARAFSPWEARLIVATLADAGIHANPLWIETLGNSWWDMLACGGIAIEVADCERAAAEALLAGAEPAPVKLGIAVPLALLLTPILLVIGFPLPLRLTAELPRAERAE